LTGAEAQQVKIETQEQIKKEIATGKSASLPDWVQNLKLKGDLRLRYQYKHEKANNDFAKDAHIGRIRFRLGLQAKINEKLLAGVGIATGSGDPRSTNITFGSYSTKKSIVLDYGYAKYSPFSWLSLVGGKMLLGDTLWEPSDLIWDTDITPEGAIFHLDKKLGSNVDIFFNTGALIVDADSSTDSNGPMAYIVQPGVNYKINDRLSLKGAVSLQYFDNTKGHTSSSYSSATNTGNTTKGTSSYAYNYNMFNPAVEISIKEPFKAIGLDIESLKLIGEYVDNLAVSSSKGTSGFSCGLKLGNSKIEKWGDWQLKYIYAMLGRDAVLDVLPDSDRYGGSTGMRSHEVELQFGVGKNTYLGLDVYRSWSIIGAKAPETLVQVDWNMKF
ncbi:MAG: putative porin, partial [Candidatus Omnitrophica bacterium]|nr:putative porin [Candidatus Omnitrophota bacterium]